MTLTKYGLREWLIISLVAGVLAIGALLLGWWWLLIPIAIGWTAFASFFRDPYRRIPDNLPDGVFLSPADGVVSAVLHVDEHECTDGPAVIIRIFLSVLNVHVNRAPHDAEVVKLRYEKGQFLNAQTEESAQVNEYNLVTMRLANGETFGLRQVSGMIARRIVCPLTPGDTLRRGQKFGMIKFGSTAEVILPRPNDVRIHVSEGHKVKGGLTLLATMDLGAAPAA